MSVTAVRGAHTVVYASLTAVPVSRFRFHEKPTPAIVSSSLLHRSASNRERVIGPSVCLSFKHPVELAPSRLFGIIQPQPTDRGKEQYA
jgi:hypothetical protein